MKQERGYVTMTCPKCGPEVVVRKDHPRGGTSWHCGRCQRMLDPLCRANHYRPRSSTPGTAADRKDGHDE